MKNKRTYIILLVVYGLLLMLVGFLAPAEVNWQPSFSQADKIPYGNYILYRQLADLFPANEIVQNTQPFYNFYDAEDSLTSNFIIVNNELKADELDVTKMTDFVAAGGHVFIASQAIPASLADSLGIKISVYYDYTDLIDQKDSQRYYKANFINPELHKPVNYRFKAQYGNYEILDADSTSIYDIGEDSTAVTPPHYLPRFALGKDEQGKVNFAEIPYGRGNFFIHTYPYAFSNYHMLKENGNEYIASCFSYLDNRKIYWDEYYKPYRHQVADTPLRYIFSIPAFKWAYYTMILSLLVYIIFASKRTQRIIPIVQPFKNLSLEFTRTIGTLYFQQSDHKNLAEKKMTYFLEKIRNSYFLPTQVIDAVFMEKLSLKSNAALNTISDVFNAYEKIRKYDGGEENLIAFNRALEKFYTETGLNNK